MSKQLVQQVINYLKPYMGGAALLHIADIHSINAIETTSGAYYFTIEQVIKNPDTNTYQVEISLFVPSSNFFDYEGDLLPYSYLIQNRTAEVNRIKVGSKVYMHQQLSARIIHKSPQIVHQQTNIRLNGTLHTIKKNTRS